MDALLPRVSVVIACYDYVDFVDEAIRSALDQEGVDLDLTIVDDASTDGSRDVSLAWARRDPRVTVVVHNENQGVVASFNDALGRATAPYVLKLDADDVLPPGALRRAVDVLEAHPDVAFVYGHVLSFDGPTPTGTATRVKGVRIWRGEQWLRLRSRRVRNPIYSPEGMIRRSALLDVGGHRPEIPAASDFNLWLRLATTGSVARISGAVQGLYRQNPGSLQHTVHQGKLLDFRARRDAFDLFVDECGARLEDASGYRRTVHRTLARDALRLAFEELDDGGEAAPYLEEALRLDPAVTRSLAWWSLSRRLARGSDGIVPRIERTIRDLQARVRWRVWRRWGV
jgi:hypothetical protein